MTIIPLSRPNVVDFLETMVKNGFPSPKMRTKILSLPPSATDKEIIELIKEIATVMPDYSSSYITKLDIQDHNLRYKIARIIAKKCPGSTAFRFKNFKITSKTRIFKLAKLIAASNGGCFSQFFENFGIKNKKKCYELAKLAASNNGGETSHFIKNYKLTNETWLFEIAKIAAQTNPIGTGHEIKNYGFNEKQRFEIAKIAAQTFAAAFRTLPQYELSNPIQIARIAFQQIGSELFTRPNIYTYFTPNVAGRFKLFKETYSELFHIDFNFNDLTQKIDALTHPETKTNATILFHAFYSLCQLHPDQKLLTEFLNLHPTLLPTIFEGHNLVTHWPILESILEITANAPIANTAEKQMALLPLLTMDIDDKEHFVQKLLQCDLRNISFRTPLILLLHALKKDNQLTPTERKNLLNSILNNPKDKIISLCYTIKAIYDLKGSVKGEDLTHILTKLFKKLLPELKLEQDLTLLLHNTFFKSRHPMAIFIYAGRLATCKETSPLKNLTLFINSIFANKFIEIRRDITQNEHLQFLNQKHPQILESYHQGSTKQVRLEETSTSNENPIHKIIQQSLQNKHLTDQNLRLDFSLIPSEEQNFARFYAKNDPADEIKKLSKEKGNSRKTDQVRFKQLNEQVIYLKLQMYLLKLMEPNATEADYNQCYTAFSNALLPNNEFLNDLKSMAVLFQAKSKLQETYTLSDTDDPYEIFLCGTEVEGSCQRIEGDPDLNKGLLGYLLNGQTRLLTLKANETITARAIIRLLIDQNDKPVILIEPVYPHTIDSKLEKSLINFAKEKAEKLGIPLVKRKDSSPNITVRNLGSLAIEYVDAISDLEEIYEINGICI